MRRFRFWLLLLGVLGGVNTSAQTLIPTPRHTEWREGYLHLTTQLPLCTLAPEAQPAADYLTEKLGLQSGVALAFQPAVWLDINSSLPQEHYTLEVSPEGVALRGGDYRGLFYGVQTLLQLLPADLYARGEEVLPADLPCCRIEDGPKFAYRAFHLDVARTWMDGERVKRYIDLAAYHKLNTLHWHLTDDEGWRIEILSHPELAEVGGFRGGDSPIKAVYGRWEERYGGYYTQEQVREIIRYAQQRGIEIIPEIDLPGHSRAVARIHPEIVCSYPQSHTATAGYDLRNVWCAAREENFELLADILKEVCELFPSRYIHIGGDEVDYAQWEHCPACRARMDAQGMEHSSELQRYFMSRLINILESNGKVPAVWNESIEGGELAKSALVQGWESVKVCRQAAAEGYPTVVMPGQWFYLDMRQSEHEVGHTWAAIFDAEKLYRFNLAREGFTPEEQEHVVGFECTFFSEAYIGHNPESPDYLDYMLYPRTIAMAELAWHYENRDWEGFKQGLIRDHYPRLNAMGVAHRLFPPHLTYREGRLYATATDGSELYYREEPEGRVVRYTEPIATRHPERFQVQSRQAQAHSPWVAHPDYYRTIHPAVTLRSSMPESEKAPFSRASDYRVARTTRTHHQGDWFEYRFAEPLTCREIYLQTGYLHLPRMIVWGSRVEVMFDEGHWEDFGSLTAGAITLRPNRPVRAIRLTATQTGNGENCVILQPLKIKR